MDGHMWPHQRACSRRAVGASDPPAERGGRRRWRGRATALAGGAGGRVGGAAVAALRCTQGVQSRRWQGRCGECAVRVCFMAQCWGWRGECTFGCSVETEPGLRRRRGRCRSRCRRSAPVSRIAAHSLRRKSSTSSFGRCSTTVRESRSTRRRRCACGSPRRAESSAGLARPTHSLCVCVCAVHPRATRTSI